MAKLDVQTKQLQKQAETKQAALETAQQSVQQVADAQQALDAKETEQQAVDREAARQELEESYRVFKNDKLQKAEAEFEQSIAKSAAELEDEIKQQRKELEGRLQGEMQTQLVEAAKPFEADEEKAQKEVQKVNQAVLKTEARLGALEEESHEKHPSPKGGPARVSIQETVNDIMAENQRKAAEAHANLFGVYSTTEHAASLTLGNKELEEMRDPKEGKTLAEWADLTRQVTGLATALYSEPSEAPYFAKNEENFCLIEPIVKEYVRDSQTRLNTHFVELAEEYEYRRRIYKQQRRLKHEAIPEDQRKPASALIPRQTNMMILESGGSRAPQTTNAQNSNPYRRGRRNNEVRSEYEQEQIIAELAAKEAMEKKIAFGGSALPRQVGQVERSIIPQFIQTFNAQKIDVEELERDLAISNTWSDMEKCIFLDRFMQHPKDFRKIASFLRNKTAQDCVCYYYDSKKTVPYKFALKEFVMRRKRRGNYHIWDGSIQAAIASGAIVKQGPNEDKPLVFLLPESDETYVSHGLHPVKQEMLNDMEIDEVAAIKYMTEHESDDSEEEGPTHKRKADNLMEVAPEVRKYLKVETPPPPPVVPTPHKDARMKGRKEEESVKPSAKASSRSKTPPPTADTADETGGERLTPIRKAPQKWTSSEKRIFVETLEKHGRKWELLAQAVGTKTIGQIKNFYYDYKKQSGRGTKVKKTSSRSERLKAREGDDSSTKGLPEEGSISATVDEAATGADDQTAKEAPGESKGPVEEFKPRTDSKMAEPQAFPPSFASMLPQEVVSPLPTAPGHHHHPLSQHALAQHQLEMATAPSLPAEFIESRHAQQQGSRSGSVHEQPQGLNALTEQQIRELALAQQIQALQQELAATRSGREWGAPPVPSQAPMLEPSRSDETARLLNHHSQSQHQHILSNLLPWVGSAMIGGGGNSQTAPSASSDRFGSGGGGASLSDYDQHQLRSLLSLQQQQQQQHRPPPQQHQQQHPSNLHEQLALSGLMNPSALRLFEQQQQQQQHHHHHQQHPQQQQQRQQQRQQQQQQQDDPRLELLRQLLGGGGGGESSSRGAGGGSSYHGFLPR
uniref:SANT domain-containing protein n=1 Tax=Amphora coffeiformis TaxID=265554 RepID=A0A7S3KYP6_9STRA